MKTDGSAFDERALGKQLQKARQKAGLTQQALCHRANLSYSTLAKIERGAIKAPSIFTIQAIAGALGLSLDALMGVSPALQQRPLLKTKSGVSFIYFDVNGCLVRFYERAFARIAEETGTPADIVETAFWHFNDAACRGTLSTSDFNKALAERIGADTINWGEYYIAAAEPMAEMHELVNWTAQNYKTGLLTNIMPGLLSGLRQAGKVPPLDYAAIVDSSEVGSIKPESEIFEIATRQAGVPASEILLVDDTRSNLNAAEKQGWNVMWFDYARPEESVALIRAALEPAS
jgi:FMN phosphatase YigB (HAD superfamily)/DNA-binding XRE family transcriptional regulator